MPEVPITKKTRWECQGCGGCCRDNILSHEKSLSMIKEGKPVCKFLDENNRCTNYGERPFICRIYPFVMNLDSSIKKSVARPQEAFKLENLKIHTECPGYGKGKRVYANKNLQRKFDKLGYDFDVRFKKAFEKKIDVSEVI